MSNKKEREKSFNPKPFTKEEIDKIIADTDAKLYEFIKSDKYKDVLLMMGNLSKYSFLNQMYIFMQMPDVSTVYGLKGWNVQGRSVITGEKAIKIIAPIIEKITEDKLDFGGMPLLDEHGKPIQEEVQKIVGYKPAYVFDLSQTKGRELNAFKIDKDTVVEQKDIILDTLKAFMEGKGYSTVFVPGDKLKGSLGCCNIKTKVIEIKDDMSDLETVSVVIHECAHALAHSGKRPDFDGLTFRDQRQIEEVEAESIALVVAARFGLDTDNYNLSYIAGWSDADIQKFRKNIDVIRANSAKLIDALEQGFISYKKQQKENTAPEKSTSMPKSSKKKPRQHSVKSNSTEREEMA